jgi:hypothetical protein
MATEHTRPPRTASTGKADLPGTVPSASRALRICSNGRLYKMSVASLPEQYAGPVPEYDGPPPDLVEAVWAREAAVIGDDAAIDGFASRVLVLRQGGRWREAVSTALLGDWALPLDTPDGLHISAVAALRAEALTIHRQLTPLWRRRVNRSRVLLLDTPLGEGITLYDLVIGSPCSQTPTPGAEPDDVRLLSVLAALQPVERAVALAWAHPAVATWTQAALVAGATDPLALGERVRRKLKRLGERQTERAVAAQQGGNR